MTVQQLRNKVEQLKGQRDQIERSIQLTKKQIDEGHKAVRRHEKAREIIKQVGIKTQSQLSYNISEVATMALTAVMDNPYELKLDFVERRNKTECDIFFERDGERIDPFSGGGGAVDIAAFALRTASLSMERPRRRNTLILDEPFKHLKGEEANRKMLEMISKISEQLGLQIIMVSDERVSRAATLEATDRLFETKLHKGVTVIETEE